MPLTNIMNQTNQHSNTSGAYIQRYGSIGEHQSGSCCKFGFKCRQNAREPFVANKMIKNIKPCVIFKNCNFGKHALL